MKFGVQIENTLPYETIVAAFQAADRLNWSSAWVWDHLVPPVGALMPHLAHARGEQGDVLEGWTLLGALAAQTKRVRIGCLVSANSFRNPALLAKMAATVDVVSGGRVELGLGAAWHEREHAAYGIEFVPVKERLDRLDEAAHVIRLLLDATDPVTFEGRYYKVDNAPFNPRPVQQRLPLLIGGGGEKKTLRTVARYADTSNLFASLISPFDELRHKLRVLDEHCAAVGRDPREIRRTVGMLAGFIPDDAHAARLRDLIGQHLAAEERHKLAFGSAQRVIDEIAPLVDLGIDEVILVGPGSLSVAPEILLEGKPLVEYLEELDGAVLSAFRAPVKKSAAALTASPT